MGGETSGRHRLLEELILPSFEVVVELQGADGGVIEQRKQKVAGHFAVLGPPVFGEICDRGVVGDDTLAGQDDRAATGFEK